ncbi:MAG: hypothetical protein PHW65_02900 [Dehalococcoidales bacterium]|nr:hypothetical protein [Dehalococcoidales bacterium]
MLVGTNWSAYLWTLQNHLDFQSSETNTHGYGSGWVMITNVLVGSLGDYGPMSNVVDIGPVIPTNYFGENVSDVGTYQVDITNVFYEVVIPDIWITPREAIACVGGSNVQYTVTGTNIPNGVNWALIPDLSGSDGAVIQASNDWHFAEVTPGNIGTNYMVRATSVDNTNFYDLVDLTIISMDALQYKIGTNGWGDMPDPLYVCKDTTVDFKAIKAPGDATWPTNKPVWGGVVSGSGMETNSYTFSAVSASTTDYKLVTAECGNTITGKVVVVAIESVDVHSSDTNTDKIASNLGTHSNHFVCAKDTGDVILDATVAPADVEDVIEWEAEGAAITSPAVENDKTTAKLSSSTSQKIPIRINVGGNTCWSGNVWVVWATVAVSNPIPVMTNIYQESTRIKGGYSFQHTIQPASIIPTVETDDVPDLTGANNPAYPPPNVPEGDASVFQKGVNLTNGVNAKWDNSRQARQNIINPDSLPFPFDTNNPVSLFTTYTNFPSDPVVGNDDIDIVSEDNNPYADPAKRKLTDYDCPAATPLHSIGSVNDTFEIRFHAREFSRLQLVDKWYKISDYLLWKIHWKFKKASEAVDDKDYNEDGDKLDEVWIDNGSFIATDNNDF